MLEVKNECVNCGLPCIGDQCQYRHVKHYICDNCLEEFQPDELYLCNGQELCKDCLAEQFETVEEIIEV